MEVGSVSTSARRCTSARAAAALWTPVRTRAGYVIRGAYALALIAVYCLPVQTHGQPHEQNRPVDDVVQAFDDLTHTGEWLGFRNGAGAPVRRKRLYPNDSEAHIQGMARSSRPGTPYVFVSCAGKLGGGGGPSDANLMVVELGSRDKSGERLRSNRLLKGYETSCTVPAVDDVVVKNITFRNYRHPGGVHLLGDILLVPLGQAREDTNFCDGGSQHGEACLADLDCPDDGRCVTGKTCQGGGNDGASCNDSDECDGVCDVVCYGGSDHSQACSSADDCSGSCRALPKNRMTFFDMSNPLEPVMLPYNLDVSVGSGAVALTRLPDGHLLLLLYGNPGDKIEFWRSNKTSFFDEGFKFEFHDRIETDDVDGGVWPVGNNTYQNNSLVNQTDGRLFLITGYNQNPLVPFAPGDDVLALYEIKGFEEGSEIQITWLRQRVVNFKNDATYYPPLDACTEGLDLYLPPTPWGETTNADLLAGACTYISPSGELHFLAVAHYNDGPAVAGEDPTVRMVELRHKHAVRDDSPTYDTSADAGGPYVVDEGSTIQLDGGNSGPPLAAPWAQLFEDANFAGQSVMFDYEDQGKDDYDDFSELDGEPLLGACLDVEEFEALGVAMLHVSETWGVFTRDDFFKNECIGWWQDGDCWLTPPIGLGTKECEDILGETLCGPCAPGIFTFNTDCGTPGIPGVVGPIPAFERDGWELIGNLGMVAVTAAAVVDSLEACGRLPDTLASLPPRPDVLNALDPDHYQNFNINDIPAFVADFPDFLDDLTTALAELPNYIGTLEDYVNDLFECLEGFNNRTSSVRWYAPVGVDIVLYEKADYQGGQLTLHGTGNVEETPNLLFELLDIPSFPPWPADELMRSMQFVGTFTSPALESFEWSIVTPTPAEPLVLHDTATATPVFDASSADGPMSATVELVVVDSLGQVANATADVQILNVPPEVQIDRIEDQTGTDIYEGLPVLLEALEYVLVGSHTDAGLPDTHTASVAWGDGSTDSSDDSVFQFTDSLGGATGTIRVPHTYAVKGTYAVVLTVEDDDGGIGQVTREVRVVDAAGALLFAVDRLRELLDDPTLGKDAARALRKALSKLQGNRGGQAGNGALALLERGLPNAALEKVQQAMIYLAAAVEADPSLGSVLEPVQRLITLAAKSVAVKAMPAADAPDRPHRGGRGKLTRADEHIAQGDEQLAAGEYVRAVWCYQRAQRAVQGGT